MTTSGRTEGTPRAGGRREAAQRPEAAAGSESPGGVLEVIAAALTAREDADWRLAEAVADAREAGESWHAIALVLGMTSEGARQRYQVRKPPAAAR